MNDLAIVTLLLGAVCTVKGAVLALWPGWARAAVAAFPRHVWAGRILAAVAMSWATVLVYAMPLGVVEPYKRWLFVIAPLVYLLIVLYMEELLAVRALGGLLLLAGSPVLDAARWQDGAGRYVLVVAVYLWVIAGMALVLGPYRFRRWLQGAMASDRRCRGLGWGCLAFGILLLGLALGVFRQGVQ